MRIFALLTILLFSNFTFSQKLELGKVTIEELNEKEHIVEKDAVAAILFKEGKVSFDFKADEGFQVITEVICKIKIYKKEGFKWANFQQKIYKADNIRESIVFKNVVTYNLVDGKIEKTKLKKDGEFTEKINKFWDLKKIVLPNVKEGSIIEFQYTIKSNALSNIDKWNFQEEIPVNHSNFTTFIPEYFSYNPTLRGFVFPQIKKDIKQRKIDYTYIKDFGTTQAINPGSFTNRVNSTLEFNEAIVNYELNNVPSLKNEVFVKNSDNYVSSVIHELNSIKYPNEPIKLLSTSWDEVAKNINESEGFGVELQKNGYFEEEINQVLKGKKNNDEKINAIFNYVKNNFKWNGYYGIYADEGLKTVFKDRIGNVADINLLLTKFLRYSGLNAHPILISSVSNGIPLFPSRTAFNYVIAGIELDGNTVLLDATDEYIVPNILPYRAINWKGRMIYQNGGSKEIDLEPKILSKDIVILECSINLSGKLDGNIKRQLTHYNAYNYRVNYGELNNESLIENREKELDNIQINNYKNENVNNLNLPVIESFDFVDEKSIEIIGDKIYFSPLIFFSTENNPFKSETRSCPIEFPYPYSDKYLINIKIPENYVVEYFPETQNLYFDDKVLSHKYVLNNEGNILRLMVQDDVNVPILSSELYTNLKNFYDKKFLKQNDKVVLKKK
jgi:hypothetical protein